MTELEQLQQEVQEKTQKAGELETKLADLEEQLRRLQEGLPPDGNGVAVLPGIPLYKRWSFWIPVGGISATIAGIVAWKRKKK